MATVSYLRSALFSLILFVLLTGCAALPPGPIEPPPFPDAFMNSRWGDSVAEVKDAIERNGSLMFQDGTANPPYALYASGTFFEEPAIFSYFFTPKSKKLYRVDVTYREPGVYEKVRRLLIQRFNDPTYSQKDVDHWSWKDDSLVIFQREPSFVQVSYSNGPLSRLNHHEGDGLLGK